METPGENRRTTMESQVKNSQTISSRIFSKGELSDLWNLLLSVNLSFSFRTPSIEGRERAPEKGKEREGKVLRVFSSFRAHGSFLRVNSPTCGIFSCRMLDCPHRHKEEREWAVSPKEELLSKSLDYEEKDNNRLTGIRRKTCQRSSKDNKKTISGTEI